MRKRHARMGRPPRTDSPYRLGLMLPGATVKWLRIRARAEGKSQSDLVASALLLYRQRVERERKS